jgi:23S rRNA (guanine745-N1)-methyltransferase
VNDLGRSAGYLSCPVCGGPLSAAGGSARCGQGHSFDYARSGYLNLTRSGGGRPRAGDTAAMVEARAEFLDGGHYEPIAAAVAEAAADGAGPAPRVLAEIGSGTGYYLAAAAQVLRARGMKLDCAVGFDLSKAAAARAARRHRELEFVVADVETAIPLRDSVADLVLSVFSPRPGAELGRMVRAGGELVVTFAGPRHLERLRERLGLIGVHEDKLGQLRERLRPWFDSVATAAVEYEIELDAEDARRLVEMGPNARHGFDPAALDGGLDDLVSVRVARFRRRG